MHPILLEYQPFVPGAFFFLLLGFIAITALVLVISLIDLIFAKYKKEGDRLAWTLIVLFSLGLGGYFYLYNRRKLVQEKKGDGYNERADR